MPDTTRYQLSPDAVLRTAGDEALIVKLEAEDMFGLNATGAHVVQRLLDGQSVDALIDELAAEYLADRRDVERDVVDLVQTLVARGLLEPREGDA
jgi:hypothetical protein